MHASVDYTLTKEAIASTLGGFRRKLFLILFLKASSVFKPMPGPSALSATLEIFGSRIKICQATKPGEMKNTKPPCMCVHLLVYVSLEALINYSLGSRLLHTRQSYWILFTYSRKVPKSNVQNWGRFGKAWGSAQSIWNPLIYVYGE